MPSLKIKELAPEKEIKSKIITKEKKLPLQNENVKFKGYNLPDTIDFTQ
jgi:hypothetical protein